MLRRARYTLGPREGRGLGKVGEKKVKIKNVRRELRVECKMSSLFRYERESMYVAVWCVEVGGGLEEEERREKELECSFAFFPRLLGRRPGLEMAGDT